MKNELEIKTDIYQLLKTSPLASAVSGTISKDGRDDNATTEDIVISVLSEVPTIQLQEVYVNINIYVRDLKKGTRFVENSIRLNELCKMSIDFFSKCHFKGFRVSLESHKVFKVQGSDEHFINNKVLYQFCND